MPFPDPLTTSGIVLAQRAVKTVAQSTLVDSVRDGVVDFLTKQVQDLGKKELADRIAGMRSDAKLRGQIQSAIERATKRWTEDYADRDFVIAIAQDTQFADLPSVQTAVQAIARNPLNPVPVETLRGKFAEVLPKRFEPERTERGVVAWLEILREEFVSVSDLRQALAVAAEIQMARSTGLATEVLLRLEDTLRRMEAGPTPTEQTLRDYLHWVIDQHYYLDPRGTMQTVRQVQVRLQDVYVSLEAEAQAPLSALDRRLFEHELESLVERDDLLPEAKEDLRENLLARYASEEAQRDTRPVELAELVRKHSKLVILGDPGAGKTTLLRYLALRHAQALRNGEAELPDLGPVRLPLYLRIASYAEQNHGRSLMDYVPAYVRGQEGADPALAMLVRERLEQGQCLILLDGLDEVIEPSQRAEIAGQIDALIRAHEHAGNRFVVTSRVAGYRSAPLAGDLPHYCVRDMNDEQILRFLELWCNAVERFQMPELAPEVQALRAQAEIDDIMKAIQDNPGVKRLATNPLLLRVLALIHRTGARLPQRRIELYRLAADTLIRDWELARGIPQAALVREADANRLLAELAAWMHQEKPAGIATEGEVKAQLAYVVGQLQGKDADHPDVQSAVDDFLTRIRQHTGLFVERAPRRYGFMHLTFEEYFAARWLVARPREAARRIRNKLHRPRWEEPILLAIGFYGMEFPDDVDELIEEAILAKNLGGPSPYEDILHRDLLFAVRVLGDQDVNVGLRRKLLQEFTCVWLNCGGSGKHRPSQQRIGHVVSALKDSQANTDLQEDLLTALKDDNPQVRANAANALGMVVLNAESITILLGALEDKNPEVRSYVSLALRDLTLSVEAVPTLLEALKDKYQSVRVRAAVALGRVATQPEAVTYLLAALKSENANVRSGVTSALGRVADQPDVYRSLLTVLNDESEGVRAPAVYALRHATTQPEVLIALLDALRDENDEIRSCAAYALGNATAHSEVVTALIAALKDENDKVLRNVVSALRDATAQPETLMALLIALKDESDLVRFGAANSLSNATDQSEVVIALLAALKDVNPQVRCSAAYALSDVIAQPEVVAALLVSLKDDDSEVRACAADALSDAVSQSEVVAALLVALRDENESVRAGVAGALGNATTHAEVVTDLLEALKDQDEYVRASAATSLGSATDQPKVVIALLAALRDQEEDVRARAALALRKADAQVEIATALLDALTDESVDVRRGAARTLSQIIRKPRGSRLFNICEQIVDHISLPGLDEGVYISRRDTSNYVTPRDDLFDALMAVAPGPTVP